MGYIGCIILGFVLGWIVFRSWGESNTMLRHNLETEVGNQLYKAHVAERLNIEYKSLLRGLLNKVNKVTSNHLHGMPVTEEHLLALVDRQHEVEAAVKELEDGHV